MSEDISVVISLFVEHGRERDAANFYAAAFCAEELDAHTIEGDLAAVEMRIGNLPVWVAGSNPNRGKNSFLRRAVLSERTWCGELDFSA